MHTHTAPRISNGGETAINPRLIQTLEDGATILRALMAKEKADPVPSQTLVDALNNIAEAMQALGRKKFYVEFDKNSDEYRRIKNTWLKYGTVKDFTFTPPYRQPPARLVQVAPPKAVQPVQRQAPATAQPRRKEPKPQVLHSFEALGALLGTRPNAAPAGATT